LDRYPRTVTWPQSRGEKEPPQHLGLLGGLMKRPAGCYGLPSRMSRITHQAFTDYPHAVTVCHPSCPGLPPVGHSLLPWPSPITLEAATDYHPVFVVGLPLKLSLISVQSATNYPQALTDYSTSPGSQTFLRAVTDYPPGSQTILQAATDYPPGCH
jgi:hypothetical protein